MKKILLWKYWKQFTEAICLPEIYCILLNIWMWMNFKIVLKVYLLLQKPVSFSHFHHYILSDFLC
jgi:hypothetical protein